MGMPEQNYVLKDFKITASVMKAYEQIDIYADQPSRRFIVGKASGTQVDREGERMAASAIDAFQRAIATGIYTHTGEWSLVPLVSTHDTNGVGESEWDKVIGFITRAWVDESHDLWIEAELDEDNPTADMLYRKLTRKPEHGRPVQLGLSVGGRVLQADSEWDPELGVSVYTYKDVALRHVTITSAPAYPTEYLTALSKSIDWNKVQRAEAPQTEEDTMEIEKNEEQIEQVEEAVEKTEEVAEEVTEVAEKSEEMVEETAEVEKSEAAVEDEAAVEKAEEAVAEVEYVSKDAFDALVTQVENLIAVVTANAIEPEAVAEKSEVVEEVAEAVEKAEEAVEEAVEEVAKAEESAEGEADVETIVGAALEKSLGSMVEQFAAKLTETISPLTARIDALEEQEVDKSISVTRASETGRTLQDGPSEQDEYLEALKSAEGSDAIRMIFNK